MNEELREIKPPVITGDDQGVDMFDFLNGFTGV